MKERIIVKFRALRHLVGAVLALTVVLGTAGTAAGHSQLIDSTPGADESLDTAPSEVELEFNEEVNERGAVLMVVDTDDENLTDGEVVVDSRFVRVPLSEDLPDGAYEVRWRVVSADGHPVNGTIPFTIGETDEAVGDEESGGGLSTGTLVLIGVGVVGVLVALWLAFGLRRREG